MDTGTFRRGSLQYDRSNLPVFPVQRKMSLMHIGTYVNLQYGGRRGSVQSGSSSASTSAAASSTPRLAQHGDNTNPATPPTSSSESSKPGLKGWATEHDLTSSRKPVIMSGSHMTRNVPLTPAKSSPSLNQDDLVNTVTPRGYNPKSPTSYTMTKSTTDIPENVNNYENVTSPTSPKSPSWYQQKLPNRSVFDFSSSASGRRTSPRNSYAGSSPRNSYASGSPRNSYASGSPRNSYAGYSSSFVPSNYPTSPVSGFAPMSISGSMFSQSSTDSSRTGANYGQNQKHSGAKQYSHDDTPTHTSNKNYDRRSLPPQALHQFRQEFQRENKQESPKQLTSMPVTREEEELDKEVRDIKPGPPNDLDTRPMYSPPAPPVRDISSLKYVSYRQNHEKYPSWPVTAAQPPQNLGPPIDTQQSEKGNESENSARSDKIQVHVVKPEGKRSPSVDRRSSEENKTRNQSDPGFKQKPKKNFYTTRKPKEQSPEEKKPEGERFDEFCRQSKPGYPPPKLDPDGHNYGDEKYSIPSPPERDMPNLDEKSLVEKIAAVISPNSSYQPVYHHTFQYNMAAENSQPRNHKSEASSSQMSNSQVSKYAGTYFQQAMNAQNLLRPNSLSHNKNMVDSGTSPLQSPNEDRGKFLRTLSPHPRSETGISSSDKPRGVIVTQRPYYIPGDTGLNSLSSVASSVSTMRSETSSHSSGIGTMTFSDHSSAPMLRKLSEEFYRGKLSGTVPNEKRMSSASTYEELKSPRDSMFGGMKEAESYSSVVIHAHESSGIFGRDDVGSSPSISSKPEVSDSEHELYGDNRHKARYSMDSATMLQKHPGGMNMPPRGLNESRFTSESNLSGASYNQRPHSQSLIHLNRPSSSLGEANQSRQFSQSTYSSSSSSSRPHGSMEARSSGSRVGSDSSAKGEKGRNGSDSVFYDRNSPVSQDSKKDSAKSATLGRKESMKMAYGTYDENEHHYATPYGHQRNSSEVLSPNANETNTVHGRSMSFNDYMPMHMAQSEAYRLDKIKEEGSEIRWQEAVKKSKSLSRVNTSNYENISIGLKEGTSSRSSDSERSDTDKKKESKGLRRIVSEQFRPKKQDKSLQRKSDSNKSEYNSSGGESSKGNKSDGETSQKVLSHQNFSDSDLKSVQQRALLDFVERKSDKSRSSDSSEPASPVVKDTSPGYPPPPPPADSASPVNTTAVPQQPASPFADITKRYNYTKAQRNESLRRTQSINPIHAGFCPRLFGYLKRQSAAITVDRLPLRGSILAEQDRQEQLPDPSNPRARDHCNWALKLYKLDFSTACNYSKNVYTMSEVQQLSDTEVDIENNMGNLKEPLEILIPQQGNNDSMVTSPIYHNLSTGDYPRRPPPPVPGVNEEAPPALPPRSYQKFTSSKSESFLLSGVSQNQRDELKESYNRDTASAGSSRWDSSGTGTLKEDAYAQQLRRQARRYSEQSKPISMQVVSTKSTVQVSLSQSYKQEPTTALEAVPVQKLTPASSPIQTDAKASVYNHSPPSSRDRLTPEPPPLPTPLKNGETEISVDLNTTADFPPPPVEFMSGTELEQNKDRCADDSYGSYKTRTAPRELGKYKRTSSDTSLLRSHQDSKPFRPHPDLNSRDVAEITPNKPPRKKLELHGRNSPTQGYRSNSPALHGVDSQKPAPQVPAFQPAEVSTVQHAQKSMAKPLPQVSVQKLTSPSSVSNTSGSFVSTVVQRPAMNQAQEKTLTEEELRCSVKDRVKNIEVFSHSPVSSKSQRQSGDPANKGSISPDEKDVNAADSLEQLESSIKSSDSFRDRLRPVVKRVDNDKPEQQVTPERVSTDAADSVRVTPPVVPNRTYRQKQPSVPNEPVFRKNSFQNHNAPRPYESRNSGSANIHNPLNHNNYNNYKPGSVPESKRSPGQSVPEPQVPARPQKQNLGPYNEQNLRDQNSNIPSPDTRLKPNYTDENVQKRENTQTPTLSSGNKRNYEKSFSRSRTHSSGSSNNSHNSDSHQSDKNVANFHTRLPGNTQSEQNVRGNSHRNDQRGDSFEHRPQSHDHRSPGQSRNSSSELRNVRSHLHHVDNHVASRNNSQSESSSRTNNYDAPCTDVSNKSRGSVTNPEKDRHGSHLVTVNHGRQPSAEELECDQKAQELAKVLKDSDKQLSEVLTSDSKKIRMQYLDGLLPVDSDEGQERRPRSGTKTEPSAEEQKDKTDNEPTSPMPSNYYVSPPKAMIELEIRKFGDQLTQDIGDNDSLAEKKEELLQSMVKKVDVLKDDKKELLIDIEENESLGKQVASYVEKHCRNQQEKDKYKSYIDDIDKIIRLLLKLSGLLARAENTIQGLTENTNEKIKKMTFDKRDRLYQQHEDAKELKTDIDRRSDQVEAILHDCFTEAQLEDYHYYIKMKSKYTIQMQELEDKITLGNEQITALQKSIPTKSKS
ncbi:uncharacterized protein LOC132753256 [Ruditapes philippinarum]|uniref:uncharacterized protein LOC132753256 n=1 Tax=Ruditapes philippinarum TaxID=129788 RepID=UPI00295A9D59|nr:uncharacterized protein LOC132753256 [Ruditapes philippinarum]